MVYEPLLTFSSRPIVGMSFDVTLFSLSFFPSAKFSRRRDSAETNVTIVLSVSVLVTVSSASFGDVLSLLLSIWKKMLFKHCLVLCIPTSKPLLCKAFPGQKSLPLFMHFNIKMWKNNKTRRKYPALHQNNKALSLLPIVRKGISNWLILGIL